MSEPTYRVELTHKPENGTAVEWEAAVYVAAEYDADDPYCTPVFNCYRSTRDEAFMFAQAWCKAKAQAPDEPSTEFLTEDGDRWEGMRLVGTETECPRCKGMGMLRDPLHKDPIECGTCGGTGAVTGDPHEVQR